MLPAPSLGVSVHVNAWVMPGMPACPRNSAYSDQANAAIVPSETSVSIVAAPWRRFTHAARWKGQPPHTMTGAASVSDNHCQYVNCSAGTIATTTTGRLSAAEIHTRVRSACSSGSRGSEASVDFSSCAGRGSSAVYPACSTVAISSCGSRLAGAVTRAFSVA